MATKSTHHATTTSYSERADTSPHPLTAYLLRLMTLKKSNLCLSADVATTNALFSLAETCGPSIVILKTHYDLISNWDYHPLTGTGAKLAVLARKHGFLIFEDRKFGDIGHTVQLQYCEGTAKIIEWSHITNVNMVPGKLVIGGMAEAAARWRERRRFRVRTAISVGTPRAESEDGDLEEGGDRMEGLMQPPRSAPSSQLQSGSGSGSGSGMWDADYNLQNYRAANAGRKSSIVSITTVSQHYEPFDTKEERDASPFGDGWASIEEGPPFPGIEEAPLERGLLILAQMSSVGNFMTGAYTAACVEAAREHKDYVMGFISQESLNEHPDDQFVSMTPGCQLPPEGDEEGEVSGEVKGDGLGQQYNTPEKIVGIAGNDVVIVGRGIIKAIEPRAEAERYRRQAWEAYEARIGRRS